MQRLALGLMGGDIRLRLRIGSGKLLHQCLTLVTIRDHIQPQPLPLDDTALARVALGTQGGLSRLFLADLRRQGVGLLGKTALSRPALLRLGVQRRGLLLLFRDLRLQRGTARFISGGALRHGIQL